MRKMSDGAHEILVITQEPARSRGAQECSTQDLAIAAVIYRRLTSERNPYMEGATQETTSPSMLPMGAALESCLLKKSELQVHVSELLDLAKVDNPTLAEYLE
ncbi:hypothetical protein GTW43_09935 [Streptomyces sp. SID5785]|uniref:hypothetical protein n=1 Tax=Streptomyces sp. SID5785 TaxID=2690309 RepID=UPI0013617D45|nr:hypothetical protein [Streptomyces sp. SID5785]MZD05398.1 hypothetical protein [Streptomyces sp. SID5785]